MKELHFSVAVPAEWKVIELDAGSPDQPQRDFQPEAVRRRNGNTWLKGGVAELKALSGIQGEPAHGLLEVDGHRAGRIQFRIIPDPAAGTEVAMTQVYVPAHGSIRPTG